MANKNKKPNALSSVKAQLDARNKSEATIPVRRGRERPPLSPAPPDQNSGKKSDKKLSQPQMSDKLQKKEVKIQQPPITPILPKSGKLSHNMIPPTQQLPAANTTVPTEQLSEAEKKELQGVISSKNNDSDLPDFEPNVNYNPYDKDTIKRAHSQSQIALTDEQKANPIKAPVFERPTSEDFDGGIRSENQQQYIPPTPPISNLGSGGNAPPLKPADKQEEKKEKPRETKFEQQTKDVFKPVVDKAGTPEEQKQKTEMLVDNLYDGYEMMHRLARPFCKVSDEKMLKMQTEGKIAMDKQMNITETESKSIYQIIQSYNEEVEKFMRVGNDFIKKTKPSLMRICEKHGWGMSDELNLAIQVSKDVATKCTVGYQMVSSINNMIKVTSKIYMESRAQVEQNINQSIPVPPPAPPPPDNVPKEPEPQPPSDSGVTDANVITDVEVIPPAADDANREPEEKK